MDTEIEHKQEQSVPESNTNPFVHETETQEQTQTTPAQDTTNDTQTVEPKQTNGHTVQPDTDNTTEQTDDNDNDTTERAAQDEFTTNNKRSTSYFDVDTSISGKRQRKSVEKFVEQSYDPNDELEDFIIEEGAGVKFGEIDAIREAIDKHKAVDLKKLYQCIFPQVKGGGKKATVKKDLRQFSGYTSDVIVELATEKLHKYEASQLRDICKILNLQLKGTKLDLVERIVEFCKKPTSKGKSSHTSSSRKKSASPSKKSKPKSKPKKSADDEEEQEDDEEPDDEEEQDETEQIEGTTTEPTKSPDTVHEPTEEQQSQLQSEITSLIKPADLHDLTVKKIIAQLSDQFDDEFKSQYKPYIKQLINQTIQSFE